MIENRGLRDRERHEQEDEVVQPHDRAQRERRGDRARERARIVATSGQHDAGDEQAAPERRRVEALPHRRAQPERGGHAHDRVAVLGLDVGEPPEQVEVAAEPVEPDRSPGDERHDDTDGDCPERRAEPTGRERPHEQRPEQELRRDGQAQRDGGLTNTVAIPPHDGERERERDRDVGEEHAARDRHPQQRRRVAADVADAEEAKREPEHREHARRHDQGDEIDRELRERQQRPRRAAADTRTPSGPRGWDRRARGTASRPSSIASAAGRYANRTSQASRSCAPG